MKFIFQKKCISFLGKTKKIQDIKLKKTGERKTLQYGYGFHTEKDSVQFLQWTLG